MKLEHLAIWVRDLKVMKDFYIKYFGMSCNEKYVNSKKNFASYFLSFDETSARIEIMTRPDITESKSNHAASFGITHFAISLGSKEKVDNLTEQLRKDGYTIFGEPRTTGDGYYESVILDPEGNHVELVA